MGRDRENQNSQPALVSAAQGVALEAIARANGEWISLRMAMRLSGMGLVLICADGAKATVSLTDAGQVALDTYRHFAAGMECLPLDGCYGTC